MKPSNNPHPGSKEAVDLGCTCPVMDNHYGRGYQGVEGIYVYNQDCNLHSQMINEIIKNQENDN